GLTYRATDMDAALNEEISEEIAQYKQSRDVLWQASASLLSDQAPVDGTSWDVLQELADDRLGALIFAFKADPGDGRVTIRPRGLAPELDYAVYSLDVGLLGTVKGDAIMR